ncbi:hypothetical protein Ahy_A02g006247 isoform E [Arachis hypogaea]|uniref:ATP-dependent DNA helicase 2 subunit KU80 n=1 Tax=Arachis hypogaea TaxID=3818 RepID=A0A445E9F5_ARAHY|nr:hypothetical protein Ahy_A02g006247 isoform E [Arachis hypogaea]
MHRCIFSCKCCNQMQEALVLLLDVGPSMHSVIPEIEKVCSMLVEKKLIFTKYDEVGVVLFGTEDTDNELTEEVGGYQHVVVLKNIKVVEGDIVEALQQLPRGATHVLDAIIVGMDMLIKKFGETNKGKKRLCLITNAQCPIKEPFEGTKEEQVTTIAKQMIVHGMRMESIILRGKLSQDANKKIMDENDQLLRIFSTETSARSTYVENPVSLLGALRTRNITPSTIFKGDLELSPKLRIKVLVYKKTAEEKFPTLKKFSDKAASTDKFATHEVKVDYEYKSSQEPDKVVPPDQRIKGYRYGPQIVPISQAEWDAVKFKPEKGLKLLGFTDSSNVLRHQYMKDVNVFVAETGNTKATLALSSLARAMKEMNKVAILRCVWRHGQANVVIGVLTPNLSDKENIPDSLYFNVLPFAEDVREFQFPSFSNFPAPIQPNEQQLEAAANLVKMLDLAPQGKEEVLLPDFTPNPRFYRYLELKSKHADAAVPPLDDTLKKITEPDDELLQQNKSVIEKFRRSFELKENPRHKKSRRLLREERYGSSEENSKGEIPALASNLIEDKSNVEVDNIGDLTPVQDFEAMFARRDNPDWVVKAIDAMKNKIHDLIEDSHEGDNNSKALECLAALRKGCINEQEPKQFNNFLRDLWSFCQEKNLHGFCDSLSSKGITLIPKSEAADSEVTEDEARSFLVKSQPKLNTILESVNNRIPYEYKAVDLVKGEQFSPEFEKLNPLHCVPVLADDHVVVSDSYAIFLYLEEKYTQKPLLPVDPQIRALNLQIASMINSSIQPYHMISALKDMEKMFGAETKQWAQYKIDKGFLVLDAIVVGLDMLIKMYPKANKVKKRLCLITNAQCPIKASMEGTKEEQVTTIAKQMSVHGTRMESIIVRGKLCQKKANKTTANENHRLLNIFSEETSTRIVYVGNPVSLFGALKTQNKSPHTVFRGDLELSSNMKIKVWVYKKTIEELPNLKKCYEFPDIAVPSDQRVRGYHYGPQIVPISKVALDAVKFKPEKGVKLLGFTNSSNVLRHHYMKDVNIFIPEPENKKAMVALSALARAMKEMNKLAILRCVWRRGQTKVVIGVLIPNISDKENIPDSFYFNVLPFAEDVREFQFPSFSKFPAALQPNQQQLEAASNLVEMLDLAPCGKEKALLPDLTPNPRFYRCLELKSKNPGAAVPPIDETLKKITEPDSNLVLKNKSVIDSFRRCFEPNENPRHKKLRRLLLEKSSSSEEDGNGDITPLPSNLIEGKVESICNPTPPQVFEAMSGSRNTQDSVVKAINDTRNKIFELIDESNDGDNYPEALECLTALQKKCIVDQESEQFNNFLCRLWNFNRNLHNFCGYLASRGLTLIPKADFLDSQVTEKDEPKEALVLLLDVGPSMHSVIPEIEKVCSMLVEKKLIFTKYDEVGVVLFGTEDTDNELTEEVGGYQHVVVLKNIKVVEGDIVEALQQLPRGATHVLDAIIVGMDMLIKKFGETNKGKKRLCLITNAQCPIKEPFEGTKEEQVTTIAKQMIVHGMRMESIILRGKLNQDANKKIMDENDQLLRIFSTETSARSTYVENPVSLLGALRTRNITPSTIFKGDLELSPKLRIKVLVYKKTAEEKFPTLKKFSDKAASTDKFATHEVKVDYEYKSSQEPDKVVPPDQRIKGYRYGPQIVPISQAEWDAVKFKPEKGLKLLGFTDSSNVLRHQYMKDVNVFIAETGNTKATLALSSLARAMKEMNKVAILRCVWRHGQANVVIGVLTPNLSDKENIPDSLYFNVLPFAEDVREFQFPSFSNFPAPIQPNEQQLEAAANLVKMLDLAPQGKEEVLLPDFTPNPRFYRYLELKSKHADAAVPPLDDTLKKITEPDDELLQQNKSVIEKFRRSFELKENPRHKKSRRLLREERYGSGEENSKGEIPALASNLIEDKSNVEVDNIGDLTPVQDFEAMFARRDNPDWVVKAIDAMKNKIHDLIEDSHEGDNNSKALECLAALRKGCINEQEPKQFNNFLRDLWSFCQEKSLHGFCDSLSSKGITLIPKSEAADSEVTEDEARRIPYEYKAVDLVKGEQFSPEFEKLNPLHCVPVLADDHVVVSDSYAIFLYLEEKYTQKPLLPVDPQIRALNLQIASMINSSIQPYHMISALKDMEKMFGAETKQWAQYKIDKALEKLLKDVAGKYATGEHIYMADVFLAPQIMQAVNRFDIDMSKYPTLRRLSETYKGLAEFYASSPQSQPDACISQ